MGYEVKETEEKIRKFWEKEKIYKFNPKRKGKIYSIDTPPPTVSGDMHIGHALSYSQQDFIARYRRMNQGVFYPFGTDDNGLPTERLVEKINNVKSKEMSRAEFIELCLKTLKKITPDFIKDWKDLGISADYDIYYSTIDKNSQKLSQKSFVDLFKLKRAYRKEFPTIWCPECQTAIAQAELEDKELPSKFSTIRFSCEGKPLPIATTRPELIPACVAVFVNPKDKKYARLSGKKAKVPLFDFEVPIIKDESAILEKGTGVLMVCSYGDKFDVDAINKYHLESRVVFNRDGTFNLENYEGMKIKEARKKILEELKAERVVLEQKQIKHSVNVHDKCGTEIEFLMTEQWFIKVLDIKKQLLSYGGKVKWHPKYMQKRYENWVKGLNWDWSISRDRHFGVPIPVWNCRDCNEVILADEKELPVDPLQKEKNCPKCRKIAEPETKVLDTWATASLTPQIAASLVRRKIEIPYSLRPQAHDIIRTWAFYTIVKSYLHEKKHPWKDMMVSGFVTIKGEKMSKSKGNSITPKKVIDDYGADTLRFWAAGSKIGEDLDYQEKDVATGKKFVNKLYNASRFVFMNLENKRPKKPKKLEKIDELFLRELNGVIKLATESFENYEYSRAKQETEQFFWKDFADNYLEIVKKRVYRGEGDKKLSAQYTLYQALLTILKLIAPIMPFITEEIYQEHFRKHEKDKSIHLSEWPEYQKSKKKSVVKKYEDGKLGWDKWRILTRSLSKIRQIKTNANRPMNAEIRLILDRGTFKDLEDFLEDLKDVTNASEIKSGNFNVEFK